MKLKVHTMEIANKEFLSIAFAFARMRKLEEFMLKWYKNV